MLILKRRLQDFCNKIFKGFLEIADKFLSFLLQRPSEILNEQKINHNILNFTKQFFFFLIIILRNNIKTIINKNI